MKGSVEEALNGLLAEGVDPDEVLARLTDVGFDIQPPSGDEGESPDKSEGPPGGPEGILAIGIGDPEETEEEEGSGDKRMDAAKNAMKKHGFE